MKILGECIKSFDNNPSETKLKFNNIQSYKTKTGGCTSIIVVLILIFVVFYKLVDMFERNHVYVTQQVSMIDYNSPINIKNMYFGLSMQAKNSTGITSVNMYNQYEYGINVTLQQIYQKLVDGDILRQVKNIPMNSTSDSFFVVRQTANIKNQLLGRTDLLNYKLENGDVYRRLAILVDLCDQDDPQCKPYKNNIHATILFNNRKIDPYTTNSSLINTLNPDLRINDLLTPLNKLQAINMNFYFKQVNISTDNSLWPQIVHLDDDNSKKEQINTWVFDNQQNQNDYYIGQDNDELLKVCLKRSVYSIVYYRSFKKFDIVAAQIFGLVGIVIGIKALLTKGYNQWKFKKKRKVIMQEQGEQNWKSQNLFTYYLQSCKGIFLYIYHCCKCFKDKREKNQQEYLDYYQIYKQIQNIQQKIQNKQQLLGQFPQQRISNSIILNQQEISQKLLPKNLEKQNKNKRITIN